MIFYRQPYVPDLPHLPPRVEADDWEDLREACDVSFNISIAAMQQLYRAESVPQSVPPRHAKTTGLMPSIALDELYSSQRAFLNQVEAKYTRAYDAVAANVASGEKVTWKSYSFPNADTIQIVTSWTKIPTDGPHSPNRDNRSGNICSACGEEKVLLLTSIKCGCP